MKFMNGLNARQKEAVTHGEGPLLILAGAGSGKTRTLTCRIAYLLQKAGLKPGEILAVTFTNKAAREMRERVEGLVGGPARGMWISTFHSACSRILRENIDVLGYSRYFNIIDAADSVNMVKSCMKDLNISDRLFSPRETAGRISALKSSIITPEDFAATALPYGFDAKVAKVYPLYQEKLKAANVLDFDDLLMLTVILLQTSKKVLSEYRNAFKHIMVDEYQDTNHAQYRLVKLLAGKNRNVCVVGDDDQSIYSFRGADLRNILEFEKDFPDAKVVKLEQNYRSTQNILDTAWSLVSNNPGRKPKKLWTELGEGEKVDYLRVVEEEAEALCVAREIKKGVREGRPLTDYAVLYRTNTQSRSIEEAFRKEGVPYVVVGGMKYYDRKEIKDVINYLKAISNPNDSISLKAIVNTPPRGIGEATMKMAAQLALPDNLPLIGCLARLLDDEALSAGPKKRIKEFLQMFDGFLKEKHGLSPVRLAEKVLTDTRYIEHVRESTGVDAQGKIDNIKELLGSLEDFERTAEKPTLEEYLAQVALITDWDNVKADNPRVTLMTLHLSKGLEFPCVFITGLEEGLIPHAHSNSGDAELEEERRLLYVGMTRAKEKLCLLSAVTRRLAGLTQSNRPSRFLDEIPAGLIQRKSLGLPKKPIATAYPSPGRAILPSSRANRPETHCLFKCGARVSHPLWGHGVVEKTEGKGDELKVTVMFKSVGKKKLMARMANLSRA